MPEVRANFGSLPNGIIPCARARAALGETPRGRNPGNQDPDRRTSAPVEARIAAPLPRRFEVLGEVMSPPDTVDVDGWVGGLQSGK